MKQSSRIIYNICVIYCVLLLPVAGETTQPAKGPARCVVPDGLATTRPDPQGVPTKVMVNFVVLDIKQIHTSDQTFTVDFGVRLRWKDPRLVNTLVGSSLASCQLQITQVWSPKTLVYNAASLSKGFQMVNIGLDGMVSHITRYFGPLSVPLDVRDFPFDSQVLPITIMSFHSPEEVLLILDEETTTQSERFSIAGWSIGPAVGREGSLWFGRTSDQNTFSRVDYEFIARRATRYHVWKEILPLILIVCMSWAVFWIDPTHLGVQVAISSTSMLTLIAFLFALGANLPQVSYLTRMDHFVFGSLLLVFLAFCESLMTCTLAEHGHKVLARRADLLARWLFPTVFVGLIVLSFWL